MVVSNQQRNELVLSDPNIDSTIGRLDRVLSEMIWLSEKYDLEQVDAQTLKHHADDLIGVGNKVLEILHERMAVGARLDPTALRKVT